MLQTGTRARVGGAGARAGRAASSLQAGQRAADEGGGTSPALRPRAGARGPSSANGCALGWRRGGRCGARGRGTLVPAAERARGAMSELALAAFAAETGAHVVREPRERRFEQFRRSFDARRYRAALGERGFRFLARSDPEYPQLLGELFDPPAGLFLRGGAESELLARPA